MFIQHVSHLIVHSLEHLIMSGGYWIVVLTSIIEAFPLIGSVIPGHTVIILSGFFAKLGYLNITYVFALTVFGAFVGDICGYFLGKKYGYEYIRKYGKYFLLKEAHIEKAKDIVHNHTGKAIVMGRFTPVTRALMPFVIGASGVHIRKFWAFDVIGCILWAGASVGIGYVFGASYESVSAYVGKVFLVAIIASLLLMWGYRYVNARRHIFHTYELHILILNIIGMYVFAKMLQDATSAYSFLSQFDVWLNLMIEKTGQPLISVFVFITNILSPVCLSSVAVVYALYATYRRQYRHTILILGSSLIGLTTAAILKDIIDRARPDNALFLLSDFSFPSGHALYATIFFFCVTYIFSKKIGNQIYREIFITTNICLILLAGASRLYLNVHWFSDIIGGISLGLFIVSGTALFVRYVVASHMFRLIDSHKQ